MKTALKSWPQFIVVLILALIQVATVHFWPLAAGNLLLSYLVAASLFFDYNLLIWLALVAGLTLDLYGPPASFGLHIGFLLLLVITSKLVIKLETQSQRLWYCLLFCTAFSLLFFVITIGLVANALTRAEFLPLIGKLFVTIVYNGLLTMLFFAAFEFVLSRGPRRKLQFHQGAR